MAKFKVGEKRIRFYCPGCFSWHIVPYQGEDICWEYNGDINKPTLKPSIKIEYTYGETHEYDCCHSVITDGQIKFEPDSTHHLSGRTIELPEYKDGDYMDYKCFVVEKTGNKKDTVDKYKCDEENCKLENHYHSTKVEWKRLDTGETFWVSSSYDMPIGAMWVEQVWDDHGNGEVYKGSGEWNNDDGYHLFVIVPTRYKLKDGTVKEGSRKWDVDHRASNCTMRDDRIHRCWVKHGELPNITVDKVGFTCTAGAGSIQANGWHGFLQNGILKEC